MSCLETLCKIVSEFARLILFIASVAFLIASLVLLTITYEGRQVFDYAQASHIKSSITVLVGLSIYLIIVAILGVFSSFFSSKNALKLLTYMLLINVIVCVGVLFLANSDIDDDRNELGELLVQLQDKYDWIHTKKDDESIKATRSWDTLQSNLQCCGLDSPNEWKKYAPSDHPDALPITCCVKYEPVKSNQTLGVIPENQYCEGNVDKYTEGCRSHLNDTFKGIPALLVAVSVFSLTLGVLSIIVLACRPEPRQYFNGYGYGT